MSTTFLVWVALAWAAIGLVVAFTMRRLGHDFYVWMLLGVVLGPLSVPLAIERARFHRGEEVDSRHVPTPRHIGFDVVAGLDGSDEALDAVDTALGLFGHRLSSVTLATVLDYDTESSPAGREMQAEAQQMLDTVAREVGFHPVDTKLLYGRPDTALASYARTAGMELIVVGARGHGATEALFGSVTGRLVGASEIPVFVGPGRSVSSDDGAESEDAGGAKSIKED